MAIIIVKCKLTEKPVKFCNTDRQVFVDNIEQTDIIDNSDIKVLAVNVNDAL